VVHAVLGCCLWATSLSPRVTYGGGQSGRALEVSFTLLLPGDYSWFCFMVAHFRAGMLLLDSAHVVRVLDETQGGECAKLMSYS